MGRINIMKLWKKNLILIIAVIIIISAPLLFIKGAQFASAEIESLLIALQAAIGAGIVGFVLGRITSNKPDSETQR